MRIAALIKQIPKFETMTLGPDGRLDRENQPLEMNAYCRRAVAKAVELGSLDQANEVVIFTLGPPAAEDVLREAIAWGDLHGCTQVRGVHICDDAFAGSDTLATAQTLSAALKVHGDFDLILCGRNSIDADTGQVGPQVAQLLGIEFITGVREISIDHNILSAVAELDDGTMSVGTPLPTLVSCAERLCDPSKVEPELRALVDGSRIALLATADLGDGPWGQAASPTRVGETRRIVVERTQLVWPELDLASQVDRAIQELRRRHTANALRVAPAQLGPLRPLHGPAIVALIEPGRRRTTAELLGSAASLAALSDGYAVAIGPTVAIEGQSLGNLGADMTVAIAGSDTEADVATAITAWLSEHSATIVLASSTSWGREISARVAASISAGLTGDAVELELKNGRLVAWKPAFGGALVAAITSSSEMQMVTVRAGVLDIPQERKAEAAHQSVITQTNSGLRVLSRTRDDDLDLLADAKVVFGLGRGVDPAHYEQLEMLRIDLHAELAATRKVTDVGWLPHARQIGITGRSVSPELFISIAASGKFNHSVGYRNATTVLAINSDPSALVFATADIGIIGDWAEAISLLTARSGEIPFSQTFSGR